MHPVHYFHLKLSLRKKFLQHKMKKNIEIDTINTSLLKTWLFKLISIHPRKCFLTRNNFNNQLFLIYLIVTSDIDLLHYQGLNHAIHRPNFGYCWRMMLALMPLTHQGQPPQRQPQQGLQRDQQ